MATDDPIIGNCYLTINADKTEIIEGDNVQFTIELFGGCSGDISVDIFIDNIVDNQYLSNGSLLYTHTFNESGEFTVSVDAGNGSSIVGDSINITVEEATIESSTSQVSWRINNKNVQSIEINNKEVKSIITSNGQVLYRKEEDAENVLELQFTGSNFSTNSNTPFTYTGDVFVDWGDDTGLIEYTGGALSHSYLVSDSYTIKVYGDITSLGSNCFEGCSNLISVIIPNSVTSLGASCFINCSGLISVEIPDSVTSLGGYCFSDCSSLASINIPDSVTSLKANSFFGCSNLISLNIPSNVISLGDNCFYNCTSLISLQLNWIGNDIPTYKSNWIRNTSTSLKFIIPLGTTQLYIDKGYPSDKLEEPQPIILWAPQLNGETGADYVHSYSESNGEAVGKGFIFKNGFDNVNSWELSFEFKHDIIQYTGICFLTDLASGYKGREGSSTALTTWEGSWPGGSAYATHLSGAVGYFDVTVTKVDSTHVRLQSETLNRDTTVEIPWLASATKLSFGARHNVSNSYGPCRIRNILVKRL